MPPTPLGTPPPGYDDASRVVPQKPLKGRFDARLWELVNVGRGKWQPRIRRETLGGALLSTVHIQVMYAMQVIENSGLCILDDVANSTHIVFGKVVVHRQAHKAISIPIALGQGTSVVFGRIIRAAMEA